MAKKTRAQLTREINEVLAKRPSRKRGHSTRRKEHELFYLSEDQEGGKHAVHFEQFDKLTDAIDALAQLPAGSITYGTAKDGPEFMLVWGAPEHTDILYWTDGDLSAQPRWQTKTKEVRDAQAPAKHRGDEKSMHYFWDRYDDALARLRARDYKWK